MKKEGFTLIEMLAYVTILSIIVLAISGFFLWVVRSNSKARAIWEVSDNARRVMETLSLEIKEAEGIYAPTSLFSTSSGQLSLETKKYLPDGETETYVDFFLCEKRLCLKKEGQSPVAITSESVEVNNLGFYPLAATSTSPSIRINLEIDYKRPAENPEYLASFSATSAVSIRSY